MKHLARLVTFLAMVVVTACGTAPLALPEADTTVGTSAVYAQAAGVAFLPPVGPSVDTSNFYAGASLVIKVTARPSGQLLQTYATSDGSIRVEDTFYQALWRVRGAVEATPPAVTEVRVSVYASALGNATVAESCAAAGIDPCLLGHFDAAIRTSRNAKRGAGVLDLTRTQTLPIKVFLEAAPGLRPERLSDLTPLTPKVTFEDAAPNCAVNEFTMPGQGLNALGAGLNALGAGLNALGAGLNALGAVGGLFLFGPGETADAPSIRILDGAEAGALAASAVPWWPEEYAAILVVDDFGDVYRLDEAGPLLAPADGLEEEDLQGLVGPGTFSHGALVLHQIVEMAQGAGFAEATDFPWIGDDFRVFYRNVGEGEGATTLYLVVAAVNTGGSGADQVDTGVIAQRITSALDALRLFGLLYDGDLALGLDVRRAVLNMSFVIVPCSVLKDFDVSGIETFDLYRDALAASNGVADDFDAELGQLLLSPLAGDPLLAALTCAADDTDEPFDPMPDYWPWSDLVMYADYTVPNWGCASQDRATVYVASSGNFGLLYAMYPAAAPGVLAVGSQDAIGDDPDDGFSTTKSVFSNSGEVLAPGALYLLGVSSATGAGARALAYAGTSFAAPVLSLVTALDLMNNVPFCTDPLESRFTGEDDDANTLLLAAAARWCTD